MHHWSSLWHMHHTLGMKPCSMSVSWPKMRNHGKMDIWPAGSNYRALKTCTGTMHLVAINPNQCLNHITRIKPLFSLLKVSMLHLMTSTIALLCSYRWVFPMEVIGKPFLEDFNRFVWQLGLLLGVLELDAQFQDLLFVPAPQQQCSCLNTRKATPQLMTIHLAVCCKEYHRHHC
jgi:hypothetical protein